MDINYCIIKIVPAANEADTVSILQWLDGLSMGQYAETFREAGIDFDVLPDLTETDLASLGVRLGDRKRIMKAIRTRPAAPAGPQPERMAVPETLEAERRQLTVMFVDMVGSTALSGRLDPEEMRDVLRLYQNAAAGEISRFGGHIAKLMGDGILAYFGFPRAYEDAAERSVRAGLAALDAVGRVTSADGERIAARIGIATGTVLVGELIGEAEAQEREVVGETPNLAARLQSLGEAGDLVVASGTRQLLGRMFVTEPIDVPPQKGFDRTIEAFRVTGEEQLQNRYESRRVAGESAMVGRDADFAVLRKGWDRAKAGELQVVLVVGEAGIGKSHLSQLLLDTAAVEDHVRIMLQCLPHQSGTALYPVVAEIERAAGFRQGQSHADRARQAGDDVRQDAARPRRGRDAGRPSPPPRTSRRSTALSRRRRRSCATARSRCSPNTSWASRAGTRCCS